MTFTTTKTVFKITAFGYRLQLGRVVRETDDFEEAIEGAKGEQQ